MVPLPPGERESWGAIGGIVVLVILVVLLLALLLLYRRRQKDKQNNTPTVSFSTSRTVNSEYAVPGTARMDVCNKSYIAPRDPSKIEIDFQGLIEYVGITYYRCMLYICSNASLNLQHIMF